MHLVGELGFVEGVVAWGGCVYICRGGWSRPASVSQLRAFSTDLLFLFRAITRLNSL